MNDRILSLLGLCRKAGKMTLGNDAVIDAAEKHKSRLILLTSDLSPKTAKGILAAAHRNNVKIRTVNRTKDDFGDALGKFCAVVSIDDSGFANKFTELIAQENQQEVSL